MATWIDPSEITSQTITYGYAYTASDHRAPSLSPEEQKRRIQAFEEKRKTAASPHSFQTDEPRSSAQLEYVAALAERLGGVLLIAQKPVGEDEYVFKSVIDPLNVRLAYISEFD